MSTRTVVFDLNGTLAESKQPLDDEIVALLSKLSESHQVAIISGSSWKQFEKQVLGKLEGIDKMLLHKISLLPSSGGSMFRVWNKYGWVAEYQEKLHNKDVGRIKEAFKEALQGTSQSEKLWGKQIEERDCQITFSALGQNAPMSAKESWDPDFSKRKAICENLKKVLPGYEVRIGGLTSIDVSLKGINKNYGVDGLMKHLHISKDDVIYIGDRIFKGGNDYVAIEMGLEHVKVNSPEDTKKWIRQAIDTATLEKSA